MAKRGRPQKPYETSWGELVPGLYKCPDGRWRVTATGKKFTEPDERRAVARFRSMTQPPTVDVPLSFSPTPRSEPRLEVVDHTPADIREAIAKERGIPDQLLKVDDIQIGKTVVRAEEFWLWLREQVISKPEYSPR